MPTRQPPACTLITGASSGIGFEFARQAAADGRSLILVARHADGLEAAAQDLGPIVDVHTIACDLSEPGAAQELFEKIRADGLDVDCLINNAGIGDFGEFATRDLDRQQRMISVNITALTALTRLFLPPMLERGSGHIVNVASVVAFLPGPFMGVYFATKHYVLAFTEALIEELRGSGVRVTAVCPPAVSTTFAREAGIAPANYMATTGTGPVEIARYGYRMMKRGTPVAVYGLRYKILTSVLVRVTPRAALRRLLRRMNTQGIQRPPQAIMPSPTPRGDGVVERSG